MAASTLWAPSACGRGLVLESAAAAAESGVIVRVTDHELCAQFRERGISSLLFSPRPPTIHLPPASRSITLFSAVETRLREGVGLPRDTQPACGRARLALGGRQGWCCSWFRVCGRVQPQPLVRTCHRRPGLGRHGQEGSRGSRGPRSPELELGRGWRGHVNQQR